MTQKAENKNIIIYQSNDGQISFDVNVFEDTVWLTQKQMAELFDKNQPTISEHINNVYSEEELEKNSTYRKFRLVQKEGSRSVQRAVDHYNLDMIISVGYRVQSKRATQFRIWATIILKQYLLSGYAINERRIKIIEEKIDNLSSEYFELKKELKAESSQINKSLLEIANRPITINNQISIASHKLEEKIIGLLDELITQIKDNRLKTQLKNVKDNIATSPKDEKRKSKIIKFFNTLGDANSDLYKTIQGAKISKKMIIELVNLGKNLKDLIF